MRRIALLSLLVLAVFTASGLYFINGKLPALATARAADTLRAAGFAEAALPAGDIRLGAARFENIALDADGFSKIKRLELRYNPLSLWLAGRAGEIIVDGLSLTGELTETGALSISGWTPAPLPSQPKTLRFKRLSLENAGLALLTRSMGGVSVGFDGQLRLTGKGAEFQGNAKSSQKHLGFNARVTGGMAKSGFWQVNVEIEQGKIENGPLKASRITGIMNLSADERGHILITSDVDAGGLSLHDFPWQNASATVEHSANSLKIFTDMKSIGVDGLELGLSLGGSPQPGTVFDETTGSLHAETLAALLEYLAASGALPLDPQASGALRNAEDISVDFAIQPAQTPSVTSFILNIKDKSQDINIKANIDIKSRKEYRLALVSDPLFMDRFAAFMSGAEKAQSGFTGGQITLTGALDVREKEIHGALKAAISGSAYEFGPLRLNEISGTLTLDRPQTLSSVETQSLSCSLPLAGINHKCSLGLALKNGALLMKALDIGIFGGQITARDFTPAQMTLEIRDIDLYALTRALKIPGLSATGTARGALPLSLDEKGRLLVSGGKITGTSSGIVHYIYTKPPAFFIGDEFEQTAMKATLENYHYDSFEITIDGLLLDNPDIVITSTGRNPAMPGGRPLDLRFQANASPAPVFKTLLRTPEN